MVMSIQTLADAADLMSVALLVDELDLYDVGEPVTVGIDVVRDLVPVKDGVPCLVQATTLENAIESATSTTYSVKVSRDFPIQAGQAIEVTRCQADPSLVGTTLYIDKVSQNGLALIRKAVASTTYNVDQQGKEGIS